MTAEQDKMIIRRWFKEAFEKGNTALVDEIFAHDVLSHDRTGPGPNGEWPRGAEAPRAIINAYHGAFPDVQFTIEDQLAEGDIVVTRWSAKGTNRGSLMGAPATGKTATVTGIEADRIKNGKIAESWANFDVLGMLVQLGLAPKPGQSM